MIDWNDCLPTKEMQADFERFKELKNTEEKEAFKKEMQDKYNKLPKAQKEAYKKASEAGLKATVNACNDYIERAEEAILRDKLENCPKQSHSVILQRNILVKVETGYISVLTEI
jgi:hypothetical protein